MQPTISINPWGGHQLTIIVETLVFYACGQVAMDTCCAAEIGRLSAERGIQVADVESYVHLRQGQTDFDLERIQVVTHKVNEMLAPPVTENE